MRRVRRIKNARPGPAFARGDHLGKDGQFQIDQRQGCGWQVGRSGNLAGRAMRVAVAVTVKVVAAEIGQRHAIGQREGKGFVLRGGHAMGEPGRDQGDREGDQQGQPVKLMKGPRQHDVGMTQSGVAVN